MKRLFLLFFSALLCTAVSAYSFEVDGIYYDITSWDYLTVEVTYRDLNYNSYSGSIVIPRKVTYEGKVYSVTSIGRWAFSSCSGLTSVTIPNSVTSIGGGAFSSCTGLTSVTIPNSVTSIGGFYGCSGLTSITIPNSVTSIGGAAFRDCSGLTSINIPNSVTSIGDEAFRGCFGLTSVTIPNSVTSIGGAAFRDCSGLTSINIPNSVTSIGNYAFYGCHGLESVHITDLSAWCKIKFGIRVPDLHSENTNYTLKNSSNPLVYAHKLYLKNEEITDLVVPNGVNIIENRAFYGCTGIESVTVPNSVVSIGEDAFTGCDGLSNMKIEDGDDVLSIAQSYGNKGMFCDSPLESVYIGRNLNYGISPFCKQEYLTSLEIGNSVTNIGNKAFEGCNNLVNIKFGKSVKSIGKGAFDSWIENQPDGVVYLSNWLIKYKGKMPGNTSIIIKDGTTKISDKAFFNCIGLTNITIPNSVTLIENKAFFNCTGLTNITIPNSVSSIGDGAFQNCANLKKVDIEDGENTLSLGKNMSNKGLFSDCTIDSLYLGRNISHKCLPFYEQKNMTSLTIGEHVNVINAKEFESCTNLIDVTCKPMTPPRLEMYPFSTDIFKQTILRVPKESIKIYKETNFGHYFEKIKKI